MLKFVDGAIVIMALGDATHDKMHRVARDIIDRTNAATRLEPAMSFWKSLFGGGIASQSAPSAREEYEGYEVLSTPIAEDGQYQVAGRISKTINGVLKAHNFRRADRFSTFEDAERFTFVKARQIIDQSGDRIFD